MLAEAGIMVVEIDEMVELVREVNAYHPGIAP